jgi:hypothetical protein
MRFGDGPVIDILLKELRAFLRAKPYRVDIKLDQHLSLPPIGWKEISTVEKDTNDSINEFKKQFKPEDTKYEIHTNHIKYTINPILRPDGYPGIISHEMIGVPTEKIITHLNYHILNKANKKDDFTAEDKQLPYIVAIFSDLIYLDGMMFKESMYGKVMGYADQDRYKTWVEMDYQEQVTAYKARPEWKRIEESSSNGWKILLENVYLIPHNLHYVYEHGLFLTEPAMDNVAGILLMTAADKISLFLNPFSGIRMNSLNVLR